MTAARKILPLILLLATAALWPPRTAHAAGKTFTIYEYIPYRDHVAGDQLSSAPQLDEYLESLGIHHIKVIYLNRFMTDGQPDEKKIEAIAKSAIGSPKIPVSFDTEFGDRFKPETVVPQVTEILRLYHQYNSVTPAGVYATAPQNTYAWTPDITRFDALNEKYASIAQQVDFLSPVLYNYGGPDNAAWQKAAVYNIAAAKKYNTGKPILAYLSPVMHPHQDSDDDAATKAHYRDIRMLTEAEMLLRLQTLYDLGADGCIVWASSSDRIDGKPPVFDRNSGWGKALADFAAAHR